MAKNAGKMEELKKEISLVDNFMALVERSTLTEAGTWECGRTDGDTEKESSWTLMDKRQKDNGSTMYIEAFEIIDINTTECIMY